MGAVKLSSKFVGGWLLGTAMFSCAYGMWWARSIENTTALFMGMLGAMIMLGLYEKLKGKGTDFTNLCFWTCLFVLVVIAVDMALASLSIVEGAFGL